MADTVDQEEILAIAINDAKVYIRRSAEFEDQRTNVRLLSMIYAIVALARTMKIPEYYIQDAVNFAFNHLEGNSAVPEWSIGQGNN